MRRLALLALLALAPARGQEPDPAWRQETVELGVPLNGCAVGDVDPTRPGNEVVAVAQDGTLFVAWRTADGWRREELARSAGELMQVAVGDLFPDVPGDEVAAVGVQSGREGDGAPGVLIVASRDEQGWSADVVHQDEVLLHAVAIDGETVWCGGAGPELHALSRGDGDGWRRRDVPNRPAQARSAAPTPGRGLVLTYRDGVLARVVARPDGGLALEELDRREKGRARVGAHGDDLLVADDDGLLSLLPAQGPRVEVHRSTDKLRGAVLADLDPAAPGVEAATAGYDGKVVLLRRAGEAWRASVVATDGARLHHLAAGELPGVGLSLVGASLGGRLVIASRR